MVGKSTVENGALLTEENHIWLHKQPKEIQRIINEAFQEYKKNFKKCDVIITNDIQKCDFEINLAEIEITDKIKVYNRSKSKAETRKTYEEYLKEREEK